MYGVGVAEQVVQIAEDFLIRTGEKDAEDVVLAVAELMEFDEGQRGMMGVGDASVEQVLTGERNGTPVPPPEEGYSVTGEAEDDA